MKRASELSVKQSEKDIGELQQDLMLTIMYVVLFAVGCVLIIYYFAMRASGALQPIGIPFKFSDKFIIDSLAARALLMFAATIAIAAVYGSTFVALAGRAWGSFFVSSFEIPIALIILLLPMWGGQITFDKLGIGFRGFWKHLGWAIAGACANVPMITLFALLGKYLFSWLPSGEHPLTYELNEPSAIIPAILVAAVLAPIFEEILFRGCIFQGLARRWNKPLLAGVLSSFAFAAIHPQGGESWLVLGWIGGMAAILTYQTGSLMPAIYLHAINNSVAVSVDLLYR